MQLFSRLRSSRGRWSRVLLFAGIALLAVACAQLDDSEAAEYGVVPAPPLPAAVPTVDFDPTLAIANADGSIVVALDDGRLSFVDVNDTTVVDGLAGDDAELRAVAADGTKAALFSRPSPSTSLITVVERGAGEVSEFELRGLIEPEAFSTDGALLYVIDHQVDTAGAYRVRPFDLTTGRLGTILGPSKVPLVEDMNGTGRRQVWSPGGERLNTLYIRQTHHHHDDGSTHGHGQPGTDGFVHVLDLNEEWAYCLDLPSAFGAGDLATSALAVSPDGRTLAVADLQANEVAFASADKLEVTHTLPFPDFDVGDDLHIGLTANAVVIGSGRQLQWFDAETMEPLSELTTVNRQITAFSSGGTQILGWTGAAQPLMLTPPT